MRLSGFHKPVKDASGLITFQVATYHDGGGEQLIPDTPRCWQQ